MGDEIVKAASERVINRADLLKVAGAAAFIGCLPTVVGTREAMAAPRGFYVAIGDSITVGPYLSSPGQKWVSRYSRRASEATGERLELKNRGVGGDTSGDVLRRLQRDRGLRDAVAGASVVTVYVGYNDIRIPRLRYKRGSPSGADHQGHYRAVVRNFGENFARIMQTVRRLAPDALVRTADVYYPAVGTDRRSKSHGKRSDAEVHSVHLNEMNRRIREISNKRGAKVAPVYRRFNGPPKRGTPVRPRDPVAAGLLAKDNIHPNAAGHAVIAQAFAGCGFPR